MRGGDAASASRSVNARLSRTASAASVTLRRRLSASDRAHAARSEATFFDMVSSGLASDTTSPADTGWAAPMWVPGAITATSAASTRMKPADAARAPDGPTRTAMGVRAASMRLTMVLRGVHQPAWRPEREDEQRGPLGIRAVDGRHHELGRHRVDDAVHFRRIDQRRCRIGRSRGHRAARRSARRQQPPAIARRRRGASRKGKETSRADRVNRSDVRYRNRSCLSMQARRASQEQPGCSYATREALTR